MPTLSDNTVIAHPDTGAPVALLKGQEVPDWAEELIGDHLIEGEPAPAEKADGTPPTSGKGSGLEAWQKHADDLGVPYADDAKREDIIAAVEAHKAEQ